MKLQGIDFEPMYTPQEVCEIFQICRRTLSRLCQKGAFPQPIQITPTVFRFRKRDIKAYIDQQSEQKQ